MDALSTDRLERNRYVKVLLRFLRIELIYLYASVVLSAGLIAYIINSPLVPAGTLVVKAFGIQSLAETFVYIVTMVMGVAGLFLIMRGGNEKTASREAGLLFFTGLMLVFISFAMIFSLWGYKVG
ncbi:MAG: hypothetical protein JRN39_01730 [Nitrososphaerota archaeon]|nr:hypothetical protein [Nitrososphaerota archaeon]